MFFSAIEEARRHEMKTIALLGKGGGFTAGAADIDLIVCSGSTARIQEAQKFLLHVLCEMVESALAAGMREAIFAVFAAVIGGIVGSFLNVCIYRMPRGISLNNPRRSFCPTCNRSIALARERAYFQLGLSCAENVPSAEARIPCGISLVEFLTAALFALDVAPLRSAARPRLLHLLALLAQRNVHRSRAFH